MMKNIYIENNTLQDILLSGDKSKTSELTSLLKVLSKCAKAISEIKGDRIACGFLRRKDNRFFVEDYIVKEGDILEFITYQAEDSENGRIEPYSLERDHFTREAIDLLEDIRYHVYDSLEDKIYDINEFVNEISENTDIPDADLSFKIEPTRIHYADGAYEPLLMSMFSDCVLNDTFVILKRADLS